MRIRIILVVAAALLSLATYLLSSVDWSERGQAATSSIPDKRQRGPLVADAAPVVVASVKKSEVPIYVSGIGTVQAYNTIAVKSQVDGIIVSMNFEEGQDVRAGDPLVIIDPQVYEARLEEAQALKAKAEASLENAKANLWRNQQLLAKDFATQKQTDAYASAVAESTAEIAQYEGQIKYNKAMLDYTTIRSPVSGRTGIRKVDPGNLIRAADNTTIVTVVQLRPIYVIITLPAKELGRYDISPGLSDLPAFAYSENGVTPLGRGKIQAVDNTVDQTTGTIKLKAVFANEQLKLWPGDFVDCKVIVERRRDGLSIPTAAVRHGPKGDYAWVVLPDNTVEMRRIVVKQTLGDSTLIDSGLQPSEMVVIEGYYRLQQGSRVDIVPKAAGDKSEVSSAR